MKPSRQISSAHSGEEKRGAPRQKVFVEAWADPGGTASPILCMVYDISATGAKIADPGVALPDSFTLRVGSSSYDAKVVWRREADVGVAFQKRKAAHAPVRKAG